MTHFANGLKRRKAQSAAHPAGSGPADDKTRRSGLRFSVYTAPAQEPGGVFISGAYRATVPPRTVLQHSAGRNRRQHALHASVRVATLVTLDSIGVALGVLVLRAAFPLLRGPGMLGWQQLERWATLPIFPMVAAVCTGLLLVGSYKGGDPRRDANRIASGVALGLLIQLWPWLWSNVAFVAPFGLLCAATFIAVLVLMRWWADRILKRTGISSPESFATLLIGSASDIGMAKQAALFDGRHSMHPVAALDPTLRGVSPGDGNDCYSLDELPTVIASYGIDSIVLCGQIDDAALRHIMVSSEAAGCSVMSASRVFLLASLTPAVRWHDGVPMIELTRPGLHGRDLVLKRLLDLASAGAAIAVASPVLAVVALLVRLTSPGPVIFRQQRVGYAGKTFTIFKFRTMYVDAEARLAAVKSNSVYQDGKLFKIANDPRITPLGRWLRKLSIDELPQFFNVLAGDMSLVGPRPPLPREVALYEDEEFIRFGMKPGITGPWQVSGRNRITSFADVLRIESAYFSGWTIWRDFHIIARTVPAVLKMDGAH